MNISSLSAEIYNRINCYKSQCDTITKYKKIIDDKKIEFITIPNNNTLSDMIKQFTDIGIELNSMIAHIKLDYMHILYSYQLIQIINHYLFKTINIKNRHDHLTDILSLKIYSLPLFNKSEGIRLDQDRIKYLTQRQISLKNYWFECGDALSHAKTNLTKKEWELYGKTSQSDLYPNWNVMDRGLFGNTNIVKAWIAYRNAICEIQFADLQFRIAYFSLQKIENELSWRTNIHRTWIFDSNQIDTFLLHTEYGKKDNEFLEKECRLLNRK